MRLGCVQILLAIAAAIAAFSSVTLGSKYKLTYATKLANTTFLLVTFGSVSVGVEGEPPISHLGYCLHQ
jgi:hypothetical protein